MPFLVRSFAAMAAALVPALALAQTESVLHKFPPTHEMPPYPQPLLAVGGELWGSTLAGGNSTAPNCPAQGCGTVFKLGVKGSYTQVYAFQGGNDGAGPVGPLVQLGGAFYGVTQNGGGTGCTGGCGTIFSVSGNGQEKLVYAFQGGASGYQPNSLAAVGKTLQGTTYLGGDPTCNCGLVFQFTPGGAFTVRHVFVGGVGDGAYPTSAPVAIGAAIYGTTLQGGVPGKIARCQPEPQPQGCGTLWRLRASNVENVLYKFHNNGDGAHPSGLVNFAGTLYGVTSTASNQSNGTIFALTPGTPLTTVHTFSPTGFSDPASLIEFNGSIYGVESAGPTPCNCGGVFTLGTGSTYSTVYRFFGGSNGADPTAITGYNGSIYGSTSAGGDFDHCSAKGCGTVVKLTP